MDESGILSLESAEATFEKEVMPEVTPEPAKEDKKKMPDAPDIDMSTLDKLKEKFGSFFNGNGEEGDAEKILEELGKAAKEKADEKTGSEENAEEEAEEAEGEADENEMNKEEKAADEEAPADDKQEEEQPEKTEEPEKEQDEKSEKNSEDKSEEKSDDQTEEKSEEPADETEKDKPKKEKIFEKPAEDEEVYFMFAFTSLIKIDPF